MRIEESLAVPHCRSARFDFAVLDGAVRSEMGSQITLSLNLKLTAHAPLPVHWRLLKDGVVVFEMDDNQMEHAVQDAGVCRCEAWLNVAGEPTIWILSNPIYVNGR